MVADGTPVLFVTFLLAIIGYVGLTTTVWFSVHRTYSVLFWRSIVAIIVAHVFMVWAFRYTWQFDLAVRNGYVGFLLFHGALATIVSSTMLQNPWAERLIHASFVIVSMGASGAVFLYDAVAVYRPIVLLCALIGGITLVMHYVRLWKGRQLVTR